MPRHVAIIMDGNGRWSKQRMLPRVAGHHRGVEAVRATVRATIERGIEFLTLFAFSSENWRRPADEVSILMDLFVRSLEQEVAKLHANGIRFRTIGDLAPFNSRIRDLIAAGEAMTAQNDRLTLTVAVNYGGRWDIAQAAQKFFAAHPARPGDAPIAPGGAGTLSRDELRARARSLHPHRRRAADFQFPALATGLYGALFHGSAVAGFRCGRPWTPRSRRTACANGASGAPANRSRRHDDDGARAPGISRSMLKTRVLTALVAGAAGAVRRCSCCRRAASVSRRWR